MKKRLFSLLLVLAMVVGMLPTIAFASQGATDTITASLVISDGKEIIHALQEVEVSKTASTADMATDHNDLAIECPTVFDLLAASNVPFEGNGTFTSIAGKSALATCTMVNNAMQSDGVMGYTPGEQRLSDGDVVSIIFLQDTSLYSDYYTYFTETTKTVDVNEAFAVSVEGFSVMNAMWGMDATPEVMGGVSIYTVDDDTNPVAITDEDGNATITFTEAGNYQLIAGGLYGEDECPVSTSAMAVTVLDCDTFTIPEDATLYVGKKGSIHFVPFTESTATHTEGTTVEFALEAGTYNYRLTQDGKITQANTFTKTEDEFVNIVLGANETAADTLGEDESNIFLNINQANELDMSTGDTKYLVPIRTPQAQVGSVANYFLEPNFNYDITVLEGTNPVSMDGCTLSADSEGVAIVTVTYDAMIAFDNVYGALPGVNTAVFVVDVNGGEVFTGIVHDNEVESIYFTGENTEYTFTPAVGSTVSYMNPTVTANGATYGTRFTDATMTDGAATVVLTNGRNIIKVTNGSNTAYHVVSARQSTITMALEDGTAITTENPVAPGSEVFVTMTGISTAVPKLAGIYNFQNKMEYTDGTNTFLSASGYALTDTIKITVPEDFEGENYDVTGAVRVKGWGGPVGAHHLITEAGKAPNLNAPETDTLYGTLPVISIPVEPTATAPDFIDMKVSVFDGEKFLPMNGSIAAEVQTYAGQALDKGFTDVQFDSDGDYALDADAFATAQAAGKVTYFDAMLAWQIANNNLQEADIDTLKEKIDYSQSSYGGVYMNKFNGIATSDLNFIQNDAAIQTGVATQYVTENDYLIISFWKDSDYTNNVTPYYTDGSNPIASLNGKTGEATSVTMEYGYFDSNDNWAYKTAPVANANLAIVNTETGELTAISGAKTDANGVVSLTFGAAGTYIVAPISGEGQDIYPTMIPVTVTTATTGGGTITPGADAVTVRIYGVEDSIPEGEAIYKTAKSKFTRWVNESVEINNGDTVIDALAAALDVVGLPYDNASGSYISSVNGLAEMDRGSLSGWQYTLNGQYPTNSISEQAIKDGDVIVLHYTDDYTKEANQEDLTDGSAGGVGGVAPDAELPEEEVPEETTASVENFTDVKADDWFYDATAYVVEKGLFNGTSTTNFAPNDNMTRGMIMTVLHRFSGDETVAQTGNWQEAGMTWSKENGISDGTKPNENVTREQLVTMLYRYAMAEKTEADMSVFTDADQVSSWAVDAMTWAIANGIIQGTSTTTLDPTGNATRAQVAAIMMRFATLMEQ